MSGSRSTTPTAANFSTTNLNPSSQDTSTTSRTPPRVHFASIVEGGQAQSADSTQVDDFPPQLTPLSPTDRRMTRPYQGEQSSPRSFGESHTLSDSRMSAAGSSRRDAQQSGMSGPVAKKKRTRTLTTPHQAAVLHALLAKSRFPNTAVREEVGRSIGLSARKVQIWFQNQRQKARRPRSQGDTSRSLSHQLGAFPGGSEIPALESFPLSPEPGSSYSASMTRHAEMGGPAGRGYYLSPDRGESSSQLSGPGIPGIEPSDHLMYHGQDVSAPRPSTAYEEPTRYDLEDQTMRLPNYERLYLPPQVLRPATASRPYERDPSRTLPPLVFPPVSSRSSFSAPGPSSGLSHLTLAPPYTERRCSLSPTNIFAYQPPESEVPMTLAPPYRIQSQPPRPSSYGFESAIRSSHSPSSALRDHPSVRTSATPPASARERPSTSGGVTATEDDDQPTEVRPPQRSGRYDPIRGTFTYSSAESSPPKDNH